jgi:type III pantothenate kinase
MTLGAAARWMVSRPGAPGCGRPTQHGSGERGGQGMAKASGERADLLLAIDISNTGIKFGVYPPGSHELRARWRIASNREKTTDEYAMLLAELCRHEGLRLQDIHAVIMSSVVPPLTTVFHELAIRYLGREPLIVSHRMDLGIRLLVDNPWETGTDRMISALAAHHLYGGPAIVIQFGTATSFDCVSGEGDYLGGAIAPGLGISAEALTRTAAQLYQVELAPPASALGKNTIHNMQSGIVYGHVGLVEGLVARLRTELPGGERARVIAHGGLAELVASVTSCIDIVDPNLILSGLRVAYDRVRRSEGK